MSTPSVVLRSLKNEDTGIDISVPHFQEEEAPLGGVSVLYEITVLTKLDLFKTRLHKSGDIVHFSIFKAYREIEDLYNKLNKRYPKAGLPPVPKSSTADKYTCDEKVEALDLLMRAIAKNSEICHSSIFTQFIGINSQRLPSFTTQNVDVNIEDVNSTNASHPAIENKTEGNIQDVFPKMKTISAVTHKKAQPLPSSTQNVDLFEEVKLVKDSKPESDGNTNWSSKSLFDEFDDDNLFSAIPAQKLISSPKQEEKVKDVKHQDVKKAKASRKKTDPSVTNVDDSEIIIKDRKHGEISLFEEQDFGEYITKDEESLFLVSTNKETDVKKNALLFSNKEEQSLEEVSSLTENLDDLLNLEPLPRSPILSKKSENSGSSPVGKKSETEDISESKSAEQLTHKPIPQPRKKSLVKSDGEELTSAMQRPEVMPRKVFLNKPKVPSKPASSAAPEVPARTSQPPSVPAKPAPPPKPKPPPLKPKPAALKSSDKDNTAPAAVDTNDVQNSKDEVSDLTSDLNKLDILKYIEQEEKTLEASPSLFD